MADAYLNVAERILLDTRRPLRPREIIDAAYFKELLPWHLHGSTQDKTLHARMAEDVAGNPTGSRFFRTGPGMFFLRAFLADPAIPDTYKQPYFAPPRKKELRRERVLVLDRFSPGPTPVVSIERLTRELARGHYRFATPSELQNQPSAVAVHSFTLVFNGESVLSFRGGKFFPDSTPLKGMRSIGLGGAVYASDRDMLFHDLYGVVANGINELGYGIGLSRELSEKARYNAEILPCVGILLPGSKLKSPILHVVLAYECPPSFLPSKAALSVNDLRWLDIRNPANTLDGFDTTSAFLFATGRVEEIREAVRLHVRS
ncbi:MAG: HTH domain-containing protein [Sphingopyxis sp.]|nr:HTH domain-containing protein [Sphingopyxis sp.]